MDNNCEHILFLEVKIGALSAGKICAKCHQQIGDNTEQGLEMEAYNNFVMATDAQLERIKELLLEPKGEELPKRYRC